MVNNGSKKVLSNVGGTSMMDYLFGYTKSCIRGTKLNAFNDVMIVVYCRTCINFKQPDNL